MWERPSEWIRPLSQWDGDPDVHFVSLAHKFAGDIQTKMEDLTNQQIFEMKVDPNHPLPVTDFHDLATDVGWFERTGVCDDCSLLTGHQLDDREALAQVKAGNRNFVSLKYGVEGANDRVPISLGICPEPLRREGLGTRTLGYCDDLPPPGKRFGTGITWDGGLRGGYPGTYVPWQQRLATPSMQVLPSGGWESVRRGGANGFVDAHPSERMARPRGHVQVAHQACAPSSSSSSSSSPSLLSVPQMRRFKIVFDL